MSTKNQKYFWRTCGNIFFAGELLIVRTIPEYRKYHKIYFSSHFAKPSLSFVSQTNFATAFTSGSALETAMPIPANISISISFNSSPKETISCGDIPHISASLETAFAFVASFYTSTFCAVIRSYAHMSTL